MMSKAALLLYGVPGATSLLLLGMAAAQADPAHTLPVGVRLGIGAALILLTGMYVAVETAVVGSYGANKELLPERASRSARLLHRLATEQRVQDRIIATAQFGIGLCSILLGMIGVPWLMNDLQTRLALWVSLPALAETAVALILSLLLLVSVQYIFGFKLPQAIGASHPMRVARLLIRPMWLSAWLFYPPVWLSNSLGAALLRRLQITPVAGVARILSPAELEQIVNESEESGLLHEEEGEMIRNIFDFGDRVVGQILTPRRKVCAIPRNIPFSELQKLVTESSHSRFPVYDDDLDHVLGILHVKDLVQFSLTRQPRSDWYTILRAAPAVPEDMPIERLLADFKRQKQHMAVVLDEYGGMLGIVTLEDLVEEIVGEVRDEFDQEREPLLKLRPGLIEVAGEYLVADLLEEMPALGEKRMLPEVETVGGLIVSKLGGPPAVGDEVTYNDGRIRMQVLAVERRAVTRARVEDVLPEAGHLSARNQPAQPPQPQPVFLSLTALLTQVRERRKKWDSY